MGATDIASRLRAKLSRRRHSATVSLASSTHTSSSHGSRHFWDRERGGDRSSQSAASQTRGTVSSRQGQHGVSTVSGSPSQNQSQDYSSTSEDGLELSTQSRNHSRSISPHLHVNSTLKPTATPDSATDIEPTAANPTLKQPEVAKSVGHSAASSSPNSSAQPTAAATNHQSHGPQPHPPSSSVNLNPPSLKPSTIDSSPSPSSSPSRSRPVTSNLGRIQENLAAQSSHSASPTSTSTNTNIQLVDVQAGAQVDGYHEDDLLNPTCSGSYSSSRLNSAPPASTSQPLTPPVTSSAIPSFSPNLPLPSTVLPTPGSPTSRPPGPPRRQSLLSNRQSTLIKTLLSPSVHEQGTDPSVYIPIDGNMVTRKIWVKRPHASPTLITINEDDLVDDVRDMILRKYTNSLGRTFDSPDLNLRICPRDQQKERILGPEEPMSRTLDAYYPGGQTVDEALIIDLPRRAPKASPRPVGPTVYFAEDTRPSETSEGYFSTVGATSSPHLPVAIPQQSNPQGQHSIAVLGTGYIPPVPSPGGTRRAYRDRPDRPRLGRQHTSSPTILANGSSTSLAAVAAAASHGNHDASGMPPTAPAIPTPPAPEPPQARVETPPPQLASPRPTNTRAKKSKKSEHPILPPGIPNGGVPPINVLIVEDNPINLKLLEAFVKRLRVRWQTAMNGRDAVKKWRSGGFHLVLMDIQLPIMNGLDATREIRRLERVNSIGVFSSSPDSSVPHKEVDEINEQDRLETVSMFKSPVIIVALTASSLQSDRHEALAAGCNDFLTKPVNFVWLERKVMEWGCMQALIDFDGWRKWKAISQEAEENEANKKAAAAAKTKSKKNRLSVSKT